MLCVVISLMTRARVIHITKDHNAHGNSGHNSSMVQLYKTSW